MPTQEISNVQSAIAGVGPTMDLNAALLAAGAVSVAPATAMGAALANATKGKGKRKGAPVVHKPEPTVTVLAPASDMATVGPVAVPEGAPVTVQVPQDDVIVMGVTALADAVASAIYAGSNIYAALANFGELSGLAGHKDACEAVLRMVAAEPDRFIVAGVSPLVKARIVRLCDKGVSGSEFSRAVSAIQAGSVLLHYLTKARAIFDADPTATGWTRVVQRLNTSALGDARSALTAPVAADWVGLPETVVCLPTVIGAATQQERTAQAKTNAARSAGVATGNAVGSAGRTTNGTGAGNPALAPAAAQAGVPNVPQAANTLQGVAAVIQASADASKVRNAATGTGIAVKPHIAKLQGITNFALSLQGDAPDMIRKGVIDQVEKIVLCVDAIRALFASAATAENAANPAAGLAILEGFDGFKIG